MTFPRLARLALSLCVAATGAVGAQALPPVKVGAVGTLSGPPPVPRPASPRRPTSTP